jgi:hypothetical protein
MAYVIMAPPVNHADGVMTELTSAHKQKIGLKKNEYQAKRQRTKLPSRLRGQSKNKASCLVYVEKDAADVGPS